MNRLGLMCLFLLANACGGGEETPGDETTGALKSSDDGSCSADAKQALAVATKAATELDKDMKSYESWRKAADAADQAHQPIPPTPANTPTSIFDGQCLKVEGVDVSLGDVVSQVMLATSSCRSLQSQLKADASYAPVRSALAKTLALSIATGAVKADGTGLQAALERGVVLYGRTRASTTHKLVFAKGQVAIQEATGVMTDDWKPATNKPYSVKGKNLTIGTDTLELNVGGVPSADTPTTTARFTQSAAATAEGPYGELYDDDNLCISAKSAAQ